ncbi:WHG domain-containing protein [Streptomyces sp. H27-C3]|uniref:WHG domain-containing protein n=1 Tax=Streptomyces sp. H27-C3 TaxID=3046305 RepID=UPI0024B9136A|nr:WHG domain-containing protein [Streptomyces sp. H27-C3]MDJ0465671.1 WHG domain-containing protein [Streptomyces sp. H27-C3]
MGRGDPGGPEPEYQAFALLAGVLDALVEAGRLDARNRAASEAAAWAGVHGLSLLLLDGPMRRLPEAAREAVIERTLAGVVAGIVAP